VESAWPMLIIKIWIDAFVGMKKFGPLSVSFGKLKWKEL
jgi:hypothetical protein